MPPEDDNPQIAWLPDLLYAGGRFLSDHALITNTRTGRVVQLMRAEDVAASDRRMRLARLKDRALLPGLVNAHSHAFQRVIRGRTEYRAAARDSFWTWREMMYAVTARLSPEDIYDASRMAFLEMVLGGITTVGEFHYLHRTPEGTPYDDPNFLAKQVVRAAQDVGLRIALLRVAYARSGYQTPPNKNQARFIEPDADEFLRRVADLRDELASSDERAPQAWIGVAPHSIRAVPLDDLRAVSAFAKQHALPLHIHVAEQPAEVAACWREHGRTPVALLADEGLLDARFTAVHAVHITHAEARALAAAHAHVCACPTTERNLGDGIVPADLLLAEGVRLSLGTDSHTQIDLLEDARELEYHLRLQKFERAVLAPAPHSITDDKDQADAATKISGAIGRATETRNAVAQLSLLAARLFACATVNGASSVGLSGGELAVDLAADFFTVDLNDPSIAGAMADDLLPALVFSLSRTAIRDVVVGGRLLVEDGRHRAQSEIVSGFAGLQRKLWE